MTMPTAERITSAGFGLEIVGDRLRVHHADRLTDEQREYIRAHKQQIIDELTATPTIRYRVRTETAECEMSVEASRADAFESELPIPVTVTCESCLHARETMNPALVTCASGVEPPGAAGFWKTDKHMCDRWEALTALVSNESGCAK